MQFILFIISLVIFFMIVIGIIEAISLPVVITLMIGGGVGFAICNIFALGWGIFGLILGCLLAISISAEL